MKRKIILLFIVLPFMAMSQTQDAWVYFADKQNVTAALSNPISILSQKALDRKSFHNVLIDERDVPVNENYITQLKNASGIVVMAKSKWFNAVHVRGNEADIKALSILDFITTIDFADKNLNISKVSNQKLKSKLEETFTTFNYGDASNQIEMFKGNELHILDYTGSGMTVAVIDAGFPNVNTMAAFQKLRDAGNILGSYDFVKRKTDVYSDTESNHGTMVLSDMAGFVQDQFVGTAPDASYYLFISEDDPTENPVEESYWVEAAERADSLGVDVINTSLGYKIYDNPNYTYTSADLNGNTAFITKGANIAFEKGMLLVNSAGNAGNGGVGAPADAAGVFSVGAVDSSGSYADFSSVGSSFQPTQKPDVVAQGAVSFMINENDEIVTANGTSFSSPILAGGLVCLWQALPNRSNAEIMQLVRESASQYTSPDYFLGYGIPNLQAALSLGVSLAVPIEESEGIKLYPNPTEGLLYFNELSLENPHTLILYDLLGRQVVRVLLSVENNTMDISSLSNGMYVAKIESKNSSQTIKILKK